MRIVTVTPSFLPRIGGLELCQHNIALAHHAAGHTVLLATSVESMAMAKHLPYRCAPVFRNVFARTIKGPGVAEPTSRRRRLRLQLRAIQAIARADVWHIEDVYPTAWSILDILQDDIGVPVVVSAHGGDVHTDESTGFGVMLDPTAIPRITSVLQRADLLIAISDRIETTYKNLGAEQNRIEMIGQGKSEQRLAVAKANVTLGSAFELLTVAADRPEKRLDLVLDVAEALDEGVAWNWTVLTTSERLRDEVRRRGLAERVEIVVQASLQPGDLKHPLPQLETFEKFARADVLVHPSRTEGASNVLREAWSTGCVVVATEGAGQDDVVDGVDGILVPTDDAAAMADAINALMQSPDRHSQLTAGVSARGGEIDTWEQVAATRRRSYQSLLSTPAS